MTIINSKEEGKDQESIESHLTRDTIWESDKNTRKHHTQESQEVGPCPAGDLANGCKEQTRQYNKDKRET